MQSQKHCNINVSVKEIDNLIKEAKEIKCGAICLSKINENLNPKNLKA